MRFLRNDNFIKFSLVAAMGVIFIVSGLNIKSAMHDINFKDKYMHILEYFVFGILLIRYFYIIKFRNDFKKAALITFLTGAVFAITDEIHQGFVGFFDTGIFGGIRDASVYDWYADVAGILLALIIYKLIIKICRKSLCLNRTT
ncbi:MAG: VanZ family protein [Candidatus Delongbacteria bacterium]|nr:VanZ family protein [Candidatus Delongbacteria bacterium]MBN2835093.1 VanZ family protein [Candidatus Delongbacteria bacterium]